ncbi:MAG: long-chain fatty acid--CoA ligase [Ignavibacteria bacterium]|nr:MAG: long-chain fatty acid--CoA ligase [Ignavibacteria bacterium]
MSLAVTFATIPEMFLNLTDKYMHEERPLLLRKGDAGFEPLRYSEVRDMVAQFYHGLARLGVSQGDRVAILSENRPEWVVADLATLFHGAMDVPIFPSQTAKQVEYILQDAGVSVIVVSNRFQLTKVEKIRRDVKSLKHVIVMNEMEDLPEKVLTFQQVLDSGAAEHREHSNALREASILVKQTDLCTIIYTSGTTGNPKGVMLTHDNFVSNVKAATDVIEIDDTDVLLSFLPLCHVFERMAGFYVAWACGSTVAYAQSVETVAENMIEVKPTVVISVPRLFERIYNRIARMVEKDSGIKKKIFYKAVEIGRQYVHAEKHGGAGMLLRAEHRVADKLVFSKLKQRTGGRIRFFVSGGAALPRELGEFFEAVGMIIIEGYGLTESSPVIAANRIGKHRFGSVGQALPGVEVKIAEDGEILTRGAHVMKGYYNNKKATEEAIDSERWLHTGDVGMLDAEGYLYITDRKKHLFVSSGGKNIAPQPIENLFASNEYIDQFVLIGDKRMFLTALIVPDFDALKEYADSHGIPYKNEGELVQHGEIYKLIEGTIQGTQKDLANFEKVRRFTLLDQAFSIENGEMTSTMKIRRKAVEERYGDLIEAMYRT